MKLEPITNQAASQPSGMDSAPPDGAVEKRSFLDDESGR
jgi:hypothetical protein